MVYRRRCFRLPLNLERKNIIFVGQDLAYASDGSSHTNGKKEYYADANGIETDGYYGDKVYSRMDWLEFKDWFEKMIALYPSITVTNANRRWCAD